MPAPNGLPLIPGGEAAGVVLEVGEGVSDLKAGDRVAYAVRLGAYCEERVIAAERLVKMPGRHFRRTGRRHDAEGHDRRISACGGPSR